MRVKTQHLNGPQLDWAVAAALGDIDPEFDHINECFYDAEGVPFTPSTNWAQAGPLVHRFSLSVSPDLIQGWRARNWNVAYSWTGPHPLTAICRAVVAVCLGEYVDIPEELAQEHTA